jgi:anti-sigma factor RsiW
MGMSCEECVALIGDWSDERLGPAQRAAAYAHLLACSKCRSRLAEHRAISRLLRRATDVALPSGVRARLRYLLSRAWRRVH